MVAVLRRRIVIGYEDSQEEEDDPQKLDDEDESSYKYVLFPNQEERDQAEMLVVAAGTEKGLNMIECTAKYNKDRHFLQACKVL